MSETKQEDVTTKMGGNIIAVFTNIQFTVKNQSHTYTFEI